MKKVIISILFIVLISITFNISPVHADMMDPLNDVTEVTEPPSVIVRENSDYEENTSEEVDTETEIKNKKEIEKKQKAKKFLDTFMWACGVILVFVPFGLLTLMMLAWSVPAIFDRPFAFITRHSVYETNKLKFFIKCAITGTIGVLLLIGFVETILYYTFAKFYSFIT